MGVGEISYTVRRSKPVLITPAEPTPDGIKELSTLDFQATTTFQICGIWFYTGKEKIKKEDDPAKIIKDALSKVLVYYYPFAGRLRAGEGNKKPVVDCNGEGILFVEGDADISLHQLGNPILPPIPCSDQLLLNDQGSDGLYDTPLLLFQVTRFLCGGFSVAIRMNHLIADAGGLGQLLKATAEVARESSSSPTLLPVWKRELLSARDPPRVSFPHHEYEDEAEHVKFHESVLRSFVLRKEDIDSLRRNLPEEMKKKVSSFDIVTALTWRCRVAALGLGPSRQSRLMAIVSGRGRCTDVVPAGYYGNSFAHPAIFAAAGELCKNPLSYAVDLVKKGKSAVSSEYLRSTADLIEVKGTGYFILSVGASFISDLRGLRLREVDYGWGGAFFFAPLDAGDVAQYFLECETEDGDEGLVIMVRLPTPAMEKFAGELDAMIKAVS